VIGKQQIRGGTEISQAFLTVLSTLDFQVDRLSANCARAIQESKLFLDAAREFALILTAPASREYRAVGMPLKKFLDCADSNFWVTKIVEPEL
jgi:hypothetical protein